MIDEKKLIEDLLNNYLVKNDGTWNDAMDRAVELTKTAPKVGEWVSVDERLPEEDGKYIVCTMKGSVYCAKYTTDYEYFHTDSYTHIIAWQPLPEAYRKDVE